MRTKKWLLAFVCVFICGNQNCQHPSDIEGLWISDELNSESKLAGLQQSAFYFFKEQSGVRQVRGFFLWNGDYLLEWQIDEPTYDENTGEIKFVDADGDTFRGKLDNGNQRITFEIFFKDDHSNVPSDTLILVPGDGHLLNRLLYPRNPLNKDEIGYTYQKPDQLNDDLQTSSIYHEAISPDSINSLMNRIINQEFGRVASLLILKDNKLILEEYFYGYSQSEKHRIYSCSKSITSLLLGIALEQHKEINVDQSIFSFFPQYSSLRTPQKDMITLKHVLTMSPGFKWEEHSKEMYELDDQAQYVLNLPLDSEPGTKFLYNSGLTILLGEIINQLEGDDVLGFADKKLFYPLGITDYKWNRHKNGKLEYWNGLELTPRDMIKIGLLVLDSGKWNGKQIVPEKWIEKSTKPNVSESDFFDYGYQWWLRTNNTKQWWKPASDLNSNDKYSMVVALGWGGQFIFVVQSLNLVVVTTASNFNNDMELSAIPMVIDEIIPLFELTDN